MTRRRPLGELAPPVTNHGLGKPPRLEAPLPAGAEPESLHRPDHHQRQQRYRNAIRTLQRLAADDAKLSKRAHDAQKASFPSGGAEGARSSGISDPTGSAATRGRVKDPAEKAFDAIDAALKALWWADQHRIRALQMTKAEGVLAELQDGEELVDDACVNCAKIGEYSKRGVPPSVPNDCELCVWCYQFEREHAVRPPRQLLRLHHAPGRKVYTRDVEKALRDLQPEKPRAEGDARADVDASGITSASSTSAAPTGPPANVSS